MNGQRLSPRSYSIARLGGELSAVINRVRRAFGPIPMQGPASHPHIKEAEKMVDQVARRLLRGEADLSAWYRALRRYEDTWMLHLAALRGARQERPAA
jgi:hypothetical protein